MAKAQDTPPAEPPVKPEKAKRDGTDYVILSGIRSDTGDLMWLRLAATVRAMNKDAAISKLVEGLPEGERSGTYKAVSKNSWDGGVEIEEKQVVTTAKKPVKD